MQQARSAPAARVVLRHTHRTLLLTWRVAPLPPGACSVYVRYEGSSGLSSSAHAAGRCRIASLWNVAWETSGAGSPGAEGLLANWV
jgi:hypothetical protein